MCSSDLGILELQSKIRGEVNEVNIVDMLAGKPIDTSGGQPERINGAKLEREA